MANPEHLAILEQGVEAWNAWRAREPYPDKKSAPDLAGADLKGADLNEANLIMANLAGADLTGAFLTDARLMQANLSKTILADAYSFRADLSQTDLSEANLRNAQLNEANLYLAKLPEVDLSGAQLQFASLVGADLTRAKIMGAVLCNAKCSQTIFAGADLSGADLSGTDLNRADLSGANLSAANLERATLVDTTLDGTDLTACHIHGISAWDLNLDTTIQSDLVITPSGEPAITVEHLEVAQFIYLLLSNEKIRGVIDTVTSKVVLILGRFSEERKPVLDGIRQELRKRNLTPVLFDFDKPASKDVTGTVETLARMARFVIADLSDPSSIPHELATIVPFLRTTPVLPLRLAGSGGYSMFEDLQTAYRWVLDTHEYTDGPSLIRALAEVISPADEMAKELRKER